MQKKEGIIIKGKRYLKKKKINIKKIIITLLIIAILLICIIKNISYNKNEKTETVEYITD